MWNVVAGPPNLPLTTNPGPSGPLNRDRRYCLTGETKVSTSTVAALVSTMALRGQRIALVDMVLLALPAFPYLP